MNRSEAIRKVLKFYGAMGFERLPFALLQTADGPAGEKAPAAKALREEMDGPMGEKAPAAKALREEMDGPPGEKALALKALKEEMDGCRGCGLSSGRTNIVFGEGNPGASLMFIGEGPGSEEDRLGKPFVGDAGQLLTRLIEKMGFKREEVYIANIVKCRPPLNRDPEGEEIEACLSFLRRQIGIISPVVIMTLGRVAAHALTGLAVPISRLRGNFLQFEGIEVMPTYHPAYLLRKPSEKVSVWADAVKVLEKLGRKAQ